MSARSVTNALLAVARAAHAAFTNTERLQTPYGELSVMRTGDYDALCRALFALDLATGRKGGDKPGAELAEALLASQVHPDSALPSRPDYSAGFDTTAAQYGALAFHGGVTRTVRRPALALETALSDADMRALHAWQEAMRTWCARATEGESDDGR